MFGNETFSLVLAIFNKRGHFSFNPEKRESAIFLLTFMGRHLIKVAGLSGFIVCCYALPIWDEH